MTRETAPRGGGIRDVAQLAGVSISTVSRVLNEKNGNARVSEATVARVRSAAQQLRYRPNPWARSLRTAQTRTIGVITFDLVHPFAAELLRVIAAACRAHDYHLLVSTAEYDQHETWALSDILSADRVDGVLLLGNVLSAQAGRGDMERLLQAHGQVVTIGDRPSIAGELSVLVDDEYGVRLALEHLLALGHRRIAHVGIGYHAASWDDHHRLRAYRGFLRAHNLPHDPALEVALQGSDLEATSQALRSLLDLSHPPTALFVNNDATAITMLKAAALSGIRVPEALSIVGFDDIGYAAMCIPGLTTVHQPIDQMGSYAARALLEAIGGVRVATVEPAAHRTVIFAPTLVVRESSAAPAPTRRG